MKKKDTQHIINKDKYIYKSGELKIAKSQCKLCYYMSNQDVNKCEKYPNGITEEIQKNKVFCKCFKSKTLREI